MLAIISATQRTLPPDMPSPPSFRKVNPAESPVLFLVLVSPTLPLSKVDEYAQTLMAQRISTISGVSQVQVFGGQKYAVRIQIDPDSLATRGIEFNGVVGHIPQRREVAVERDLAQLIGPFQLA